MKHQTNSKRKPNKNIEPPQERIDKSTGRLMVIVALGFDFFQGIIGVLPVVGFILSPLVSLFIWLTFWIWLKLHGVNVTDKIGRIFIMWGGFFLELIPLLNILPTWTMTIFITVSLIQRDDKRKIKEFYENLKNTNTPLTSSIK